MDTLYSVLFYKHCWNTVMTDLMKALEGIFNFRGRHWNLLNTANITLLPKKADTQSAKDYRPISNIHSVAKILAKVMANRLAPNLDTIVSKSQSAFIKGRSIRDNFQYIQGAIRHFHRSKTPMFFCQARYCESLRQCSLGIPARSDAAVGIWTEMAGRGLAAMGINNIQNSPQW